MKKTKQTWLTKYAHLYENQPTRMNPKFDFKQYARALKKAERLVGREEALTRWNIFCRYSDYLHAEYFFKHIEDWKK